MHKVENITNMDSSAWPSSYYGRTRRIDLEQFYKDILRASAPTTITKKKVTFSPDPPTVHEYEPEYDLLPRVTSSKLFDDGWPGRAKKAMASTEFMDFKSKIEAKLGAINDPSLLVQLQDKDNEIIHQENRGYYRHRKSPLVQKLNLRPIPNPIMNEPSLIMDTPSPSSSYTDSPLTPKDNHAIPTLPIMGDLNQSVSSSSSNSTASSSLLSPNGSVRWFKSLTRKKSASK